MKLIKSPLVIVSLLLLFTQVAEALDVNPVAALFPLANVEIKAGGSIITHYKLQDWQTLVCSSDVIGVTASWKSSKVGAEVSLPMTLTWRVRYQGYYTNLEDDLTINNNSNKKALVSCQPKDQD